MRDESTDKVTEDQTQSGSEYPTDNEIDSDTVRGEPVKSDLGEGGDASDSGTEEKHGDRLATPIREHLSPSGNTNKLPICTQEILP